MSRRRPSRPPRRAGVAPDSSSRSRGLALALALVLAVGLAVGLAACGGSGDREPAGVPPVAAASTPAQPGESSDGAEASPPVDGTDPYDGYVSDVYGARDAWICRPDLEDDTCGDLDVTRIDASGQRTLEERSPARKPPIDCFYVYPTVSADQGTNSDRVVGPDDSEVQTVAAQAAQYAQSCRVFAPVYRQVTVAALFSGSYGAGGETAYADVLDAWKTYVTDFSDGRGVIVIGHSQGAMILQRLVSEEIDPSPALRGRLVAAHLFGTSVQVPEGELVGGSFAAIPGCATADETGCVVTWSSYAADAPPPADALFGRSTQPGTRALCTDVPALLGRDHGSAIAPVSSPVGGLAELGDVGTRFVSLPDVVDVSCATEGDISYLEVELTDPQDVRPVGSLQEGTLGPAWGLHTIDMSLAQDDLVELAGRQGSAYAGDSVTR